MTQTIILLENDKAFKIVKTVVIMLHLFTTMIYILQFRIISTINGHELMLKIILPIAKTLINTKIQMYVLALSTHV